jgi:hypothetical protein
VLHQEPGMTIDLESLFGKPLVAVDREALVDPGLKALVELASREDYDGCEYVACYRSDDGTLQAVVVSVYVELGQKIRTNDVREWEPVLIALDGSALIPSVYPIRTDFPQLLPHMNLNYIGQRRSLCLFDAAARDIVHIYNPAMLVERVRWWMAKSAYGELHGLDQPLDPALAPSFFDLIVPADLEKHPDTQFVAVRVSEEPLSPIILRPLGGGHADGAPEYACTIVETSAVAHGAMIDLPANVADLIATYQKLGVDLATNIETLFNGDLNDHRVQARLFGKLLLIISTPLTGQEGTAQARTTRAFLSASRTLLDVGEALGIVERSKDSKDRLAIGRLIGRNRDQVRLKELKLLPLNVVCSFTTAVARRASGLPYREKQVWTVVGVGALGSQVVMNAARMGQADWRLIDHDFLAPHNLARHSSVGDWVGHSKAEIVARDVNSLFRSEVAKAIHGAVGPQASAAPIQAALIEADRILDLSASVETSRWLAHQEDIEAPISSYFVNPSGTALIALHEGQAKESNLVLAEMNYYWCLVAEEILHDHLSTTEVLHIGSCRNASVTIPQSRMAMFAAVAAEDIEETRNLEQSHVAIWSRDSVGNVSRFKNEIPQFTEVQLDDWKLWVSSEVLDRVTEARSKQAAETGGVLLGGFDRARKSIYLLGALNSPKDSKAGMTYFERGGHGVSASIVSAERVTMGHVSYIGEWHTHPAGSSNTASYDDRNLLSWIAERRSLFLMPGVILILGDNGFRACAKQGTWASECSFQQS